ncbi:hypothetical protein EV2_002635 [Malus domestica]
MLLELQDNVIQALCLSVRMGQYPNGVHRTRLISALENCGIKEWEPYTLNNASCLGPPLGIPEGSSLHSVIQVKDQQGASLLGLADV